MGPLVEGGLSVSVGYISLGEDICSPHSLMQNSMETRHDSRLGIMRSLQWSPLFKATISTVTFIVLPLLCHQEGNNIYGPLLAVWF